MTYWLNNGNSKVKYDTIAKARAAAMRMMRGRKTLNVYTDKAGKNVDGTVIRDDGRWYYQVIARRPKKGNLILHELNKDGSFKW